MVTRLFFIFIALSFLVVVVKKVKKKKFFERESFLWVVGSILALILASSPYIIIRISKIIGIEYAPSLLFLISIIFVLFLSFRQSEQVSLLKEQVKELGQRIVVLEKLIDEKESNQGNNEDV